MGVGNDEDGGTLGSYPSLIYCYREVNCVESARGSCHLSVEPGKERSPVTRKLCFIPTASDGDRRSMVSGRWTSRLAANRTWAIFVNNT